MKSTLVVWVGWWCRLLWLGLLSSMDGVVSAPSNSRVLDSTSSFSSVGGQELDDSKGEKDEESPKQKTLDEIHHGQRMIKWLEGHGGYVHPHFDIRRVGPESYAVFAKQDIQPDELLLRIPRQCLLMTFNDDICETVQKLVDEMNYKNASFFEPYITYLKSQPYGQLPTMFSNAGKALIQELTGNNKLPPRNMINVHWGCHSFDDPKDVQQASLLVVQRGWDEVLIPVYDMMSHRNGKKWLNTKLKDGASVHDRNQPVEVYASQFIPKNGEIYTTYDQCEDCGARTHSYGTPHIVRDYGFVEMFPQTWIFEKQGVRFILDEATTPKQNGSLTLEILWKSPPPTSTSFFEGQIQRLREFGETRLISPDPAVPQHEWQLVMDYQQALLTAMQALVDQVIQEQLPQQQDGLDTGVVDHGQRQMNWIRSRGGFISEKLEIRKLNEQGTNYGMFATEDIDESDLILSIPRSCLITNPEEDTCETVSVLAQEFYKGSKSEFEPYVSYLKSQRYAQLPSLWSQQAQEMLLRIVVEYEDDDWDQVLPPEGLVDPQWIGCRDFRDPNVPFYERHAAMLVHQRGWDEVLIPVYDMMSHRNGEFGLNTREVESVHDPEHPVQVAASRPIRAGEEIFTSYNECMDCGGRLKTYGTPQILRDYGFVESMPQKYVLDYPEPFTFTVDYSLYNEDGTVDEPTELKVDFLTGPPEDDVLDFLRAQVERLTLLGEKELAANIYDIPSHEWDTLVQFQQALITAFRAVLEASDGEFCAADQTCQIPDSRYDQLDEMFDEEGYSEYVCHIDWDFPEYAPLEAIESEYQKIYFIKHPENNDVCFELDTTWQICGSYRPHYHEMATHYAARFLPEIKRVLWVGGGDSMLLHEVLKYPHLEIAIGLELDQKVTRSSFQHFGSQPHWDDPRVQWWYGDAAKSLLMLPKEYFGTFDLILVDLSETVMSHLVTEGLDIMGALSLLLHPRGIFVKNEIYLEKLNKIFKHTIQLHTYGFPVLCSQSFILGSKEINFITQDLTDHNLEGNLVIKPLDEIEYRYHEVHDYVNNPDYTTNCKNVTEQAAMNLPPATQERSPGILMILEAEKATSAGLRSPKILSAALQRAVKTAGLSLVSETPSQSAEGTEISVHLMLKQGYVVARAWPDHQYVAFDVHLWSEFSKIEAVKKWLLQAVQSEPGAASSFRIVAGGMFGVDTWQSDSLGRGPKFQTCPEPKDPKLRGELNKVDDKLLSRLTTDSMDLLLEQDVVVAVVCGMENGTKRGSDCDLYHEELSDHPKVGEVVVIPTCPSILGGLENEEGSGNLKFACERQVLSSLEKLEAEGKNVGALVLDPTAEYAMAQVIHKIASRRKNRQRFFSDKLLVLAPMTELEETWRRVFVDKFREIYRADPLFRAETFYTLQEHSLLYQGEREMEMGTFLSGDAHFIENMQKVMERLQKRVSGLVAEARNYEGGVFTKVKEANPSIFALPEHYNQTGPLQQWRSQVPTGHQSVFQMEAVGQNGKGRKLTKDTLRVKVEEVLKSMDLETIMPFEEFGSLGDGTVIQCIWKGGSMVVMWDGRDLITLNLFTYEESNTYATNFMKAFQRAGTPKLKTVLRDEMPRGYGRVVNFHKDIESFQGKDPHWAVEDTESS